MLQNNKTHKNHRHHNNHSNNSNHLPTLKKRQCCVSVDQEHKINNQQSEKGKTKEKQKVRLKTQNLKNQKQLMFQLKNLDQVLSKKIIFINNFLFSLQKGPKLIQCLNQQLNRNISSFDYQCFGKIFQEQQTESNLKPSSIYKKIRTLGKQNQIQYFQTQINRKINIQSLEQKIEISRTIIPKIKGHIFNMNDLQKFIKKQEKCVTVWLPPASYPQFFAFLVYGKTKVIRGEQSLIRLEKLYVPNYSNPIKMFNTLIAFFSKILNTKIKYIQFVTSKLNYYEKFKKWGWMLKGVNNNQYRVWLSSLESFD